MDKPLPDDYEPYEQGDMRIEGQDIPKSTLAVGGVLWSILAAMQAWHLITTLNMKDKQTEQTGDIKMITKQQDDMSDDVKELKDLVNAHENRITVLEGRK
jgi:hypothetical protein